MTILAIKKSGNGWAEFPLREVAAACDVRDPIIAKLAIDMMDTLVEQNGRGLAAPQVGQSVRLIVMRLGPGDGCPRAFVNPRIVRTKGTQLSLGEGCLSIPRHYGRVIRPRVLWMAYEDIADGVTKFEKYKGIMAVCAAHEIDHLDGILFTDKVGKS